MKRRTNKSHKVPNVKLRPPQPGTRRREEQDDLDERDGFWGGHAGSDDTEMFDSCPRPFRGFVVCATGVADKPTLFKKAVELGATVVGGFTDKVTHLVAEHHGGAKYDCAMERCVPIVLPSWINTCYDIWLRGDEFDVQTSTIGHTLPIFLDVILCPSAISLTNRTQIHRLITEQGGQYVKEIERPVRVTHLLCSGDEETEKIKYARKFNERGEADIRLVWEEWFWDCIEFGGRFDEEEYLVSKPRPERKVKSQPPPPSPPAGDYATSPPSSQVGDNDRDNDDEDEDELASVKRVPAVTAQLWQGLLKHRGYEINQAGKLCQSPTKSQRVRPPPPPKIVDTMQDSDVITKQPSVISSFRRANSFTVPEIVQVGPSTRVASTLFNKDKADQPRPLARARAEPQQPQASTSKLPPPGTTNTFQGLRFRILGEARSASVKDAIVKGQGTVEDDLDAEVDFVVVRLVSGSKLYREEGDEVERGKYRTECWLERCIFEERVCGVEENLCFRPLGIEVPLQGAETLNVSCSGLDQSELVWTRRLLRALGINQAPNFSNRSTHLFCPSAKGEKFAKAQEWGVPVIGWEWFEEITIMGVIPGQNGTSVAEDVMMPIPADVKGKGKAVVADDEDDSVEVVQLKKVDEVRKPADESTIQDITNNDISDFVQPRPSQKQKPPDEESISFTFSSFGRPHGPLAISTPKPPPSPPRAPSSELPPSTQRGTLPTQLFFSQASSSMAIPSSRTPSPMRVPPPLAAGGGQEADALVHKINTLLGKRALEDGESGDLVRGEKRLRPPMKQSSRTHLVVPDLETMSKNKDANSAINTSVNTSGDAMKIIYEDSEQAEEKRRLMNMLNIRDKDDGTKKHRRRSSRKAGF